MDPPPRGFYELEKALGQANFGLNRPLPASTASLKRKSTHSARSIPRPYSDVSLSTSTSGDNSRQSDTLSRDDDTTPPLRSLSRNSSGLPPTPPTLTNSELSTQQTDRDQSPNGRLFADRVRNALTNNPSPGTPVLEAHSPPTPDPSPPAVRDNRTTPRPTLSRSPSSWAESYKTAKEDLAASEGTATGRPQPPRTPNQDLLDVPRLHFMSGKSLGLAHSDSESASNHLSGSSDSHPRVKHYQMESDSDAERYGNYMASDEQSTTDEPPSSPEVRNILTQRKPYQRLQSAIQPPQPPITTGRLRQNGFRSSQFSHTRSNVSIDITSNRAQQVAAFLKHAANKDRPASAGGVPRAPRIDSFDRKREDRVPLPPPTPAAVAFLEENNQVYKLIQEENVRRHSGISDGSMQVVVVSSPESKRPLRHTPKRQSLRADNSVGSQSPHISSSAASPMINHKRAMSDGDHQSPQASPRKEQTSRTNHSHGLRSQFAHQEPAAWTTLPERPATTRPRTYTPLSDVQPHKLRRSTRENTLDRVGSLRSISGPAQAAYVDTLHSKIQHPRRSEPAILPERPEPSATPRLRKFSTEKRLENNFDVRRTSIDRLQTTSIEPTLERTTRHSVVEDTIKSYESPSLKQKSFDKTMLSPGRWSSDTRFSKSGTPISLGQVSIRTDVEVCEARGVEMFPHSNDSLLVVQQTGRPSGKVEPQEAAVLPPPRPVFHAELRPPSDATLGLGLQANHTDSMDSPLTNPRAAPEPPIINCIPPTPNAELEDDSASPEAPAPAPAGVQRKLSLKQKVRRYSESLIQPLGLGRSSSIRRQAAADPRRNSFHEERPTYLSSMWTPRDFWEDYDSDDEYDEYDDDYYEPLPPGGDTSDVVPEEPPRRSAAAFLPRNMSVRMPGFRGTGGFLIGNSLGLDRHGTNVRRHYIPPRRLRAAAATATTSQLDLTSSSRPSSSSRRRRLLLPFSADGRAKVKGSLRNLTTTKAERERERRREEIRAKIGPRVLHDP